MRPNSNIQQVKSRNRDSAAEDRMASPLSHRETGKASASIATATVFVRRVTGESLYSAR